MSRKEIINSIIEEDDKKKEKDENEYLYEAIKNNKLITNYWKINCRMVRLNSNDDKKLVQIYEDYLGYNQFRPIIIDVLNNDNLNNLINNISNNIL